MLKLRQPHYAWFVCLGGVLTIFITAGLCGNMFSFFVPDIILERGFTNTQASLLITVRSACVLPSLLFVNRLCRRFSPRIVITAGCLLVSVSYLGLIWARSFWLCACYTALMGFGCSFGSAVPIAALFVRWFETHRSLAMGITSAASGAAVLVAPPLLTKIITSVGLNRSFLAMGLVCLFLTGVVFLLIRNDPSDLSTTAYHHHAPQKSKATPNRPPLLPPKTTPFHDALVIFTVFLVAAPVGVGVTTIPVLLRTLDYPEALVATATSAVGLFMTVGKIIEAELYELTGGRLGNYIVGGVFLSGFILLLLSPAHNVPLLFFALVLYGFGIPIGTVSTYQWGADLYGAQGYADAVRKFTLAYNVGFLAFSSVPGILADHMNGSYIPAIILFAAIAVVCIVLVQGLYHRLDIGKRA